MSIQDRIREWLGINEALRQADTNRQLLLAMSERLGDVQRMKTDISIHNRALGRFIAKLDPLFASNEFSPERKAESDHIADEVIKRLVAEHVASNTHD